MNWRMLEASDNASGATAVAAQVSQGARPAYPTSSKKKKDWAALDREIEGELSQEKPTGGDGFNQMLKQIYGQMDEDTKRAMIKSYQTSGGTVLNTSWNEVKEKDYEGKDRPDAPKGQSWADEAVNH